MLFRVHIKYFNFKEILSPNANLNLARGLKRLEELPIHYKEHPQDDLDLKEKVRTLHPQRIIKDNLISVVLSDKINTGEPESRVWTTLGNETYLISEKGSIYIAEKSKYKQINDLIDRKSILLLKD